MRICVALERPLCIASLLLSPFLWLVSVSGSCLEGFLRPAGWSPPTRMRRHWPAWSGLRWEASLHSDGCGVSVTGGTCVLFVFSVSLRITFQSHLLLGEGGECCKPSCQRSGKGVSLCPGVCHSVVFLLVSVQWCPQAGSFCAAFPEEASTLPGLREEAACPRRCRRRPPAPSVDLALLLTPTCSGTWHLYFLSLFGLSEKIWFLLILPPAGSWDPAYRVRLSSYHLIISFQPPKLWSSLLSKFGTDFIYYTYTDLHDLYGHFLMLWIYHVFGSKNLTFSI